MHKKSFSFIKCRQPLGLNTCCVIADFEFSQDFHSKIFSVLHFSMLIPTNSEKKQQQKNKKVKPVSKILQRKIGICK